MHARAVLAILFTDICDSVGLYERLGDEAGKTLVAASIERTVALARDCGGRLIDTHGDSVVSAFSTADDAFAAAMKIQEAHRDDPVRVRVGCHLGPVIEDGGVLYGDTANTAARLMALGRAGEVLLSGELVEQLSEPNRRATHFMADIAVRGRSRPVAIHQALDGIDPRLTVFVASQAEDSPAVLVLAHGNRQITLQGEGQTVLLGRDDGCDLVVPSPLASRRHAVIKASRGKFLITDQSTNGTFIRTTQGQTWCLRRESLALQGAGSIFLGQTPASGCGIDFRCALLSA